jgi:hypothetical protein
MLKQLANSFVLGATLGVVVFLLFMVMAFFSKEEYDRGVRDGVAYAAGKCQKTGEVLEGVYHQDSPSRH